MVGGSNWHVGAAGNRFVATTGNDTANNCSNPANPCATIQNAVDNSISGDTIHVAAGVYSENVVTSGTLTIVGDVANGTIVDGKNSDSVFSNTDFSSNLTLSGLTIRNGNSSIGQGGGINNSGTLTVIGCEIAGNSAAKGSGADQGGGIFSDGTMTVINSTLDQNTTDGNGGAICNLGTATTVNTTIAFNHASVLGGGIFHNAGFAGPFTITNTLSAFNAGGDCWNAFGQVNTSNTNLYADGSHHCTVGDDLTGDPKLGALQNSGGNTTHFYPLLSGSQAIDAGTDTVLGPPYSLTTDQRGAGFPRKSGSHADIGAFEFQQSGPPPPSFDTCLRDKSTGNLFQWNSTTGAYKFTRCSDGFMVTGTGVVGFVNGIHTLRDFSSTRKISAGFNPGQLTGSATIYLQVVQGVWQSFQITATNPSAKCSC
jgi:hypothetical protein